MKKFILILLLLASLNNYAQSKKQKAYANEFIRYTYPHLVLDTILWKAQDSVANNIDNYFKAYGLKINNPEDYEYFQWNIDHQFKFMRKHILNQIKYHYEHQPEAELKRILKKIKNGKLDYMVTNELYPQIKKLAYKEIEDLYKYSIPKYLEIIKKKHEPVDLKIFYNHYKTEAKKLPLDIYVETNNADYLKVNILDKKNGKLLQPEGYTYEQIQSIVVVYKGQEFVFKPDPKIFNLPKQLTQMENIYSKYNFRKIPEWKLSISEDDNYITIKFTNVVDAMIRKTKPKLQKKKKIKSLKK